MGLTLKESILRERLGVEDDAIVELRSQFLPAAERDLLRAAWIHGLPLAQLARLSGLTLRQVRYRVRLLIARVHSPEFVGTVRLLPVLSVEQAAVARLHVCHGLSVQAVSRQLAAPYFRVRRVVAELGAVFRSARRLARLTRLAESEPAVEAMRKVLHRADLAEAAVAMAEAE